MPATQPSPLAKLAEEYWECRMRLDPLRATYVHHPHYHDALPQLGPGARTAARKEFKGFASRAKALRAPSLAIPERMTLDCLEHELKDALEGLELGFTAGFNWHFWEWQIDPMDGPQASIATAVELGQPMDTDADAEALLSRLDQVPAYFERHIADLRAGLKLKKASAKAPLERTLSQLEELLTTQPKDSPYAAAAARLPAAVRTKRLPQILEAVVSRVLPAYREYRDFLKDEVLPKARSGKRIGLGALPGGEEAYRFAIRFHTTLDSTPEELHRIGMAELAELEAEMSQIAKRAGFTGSVKDYLQHVRNDPKNFYTTRDAILSETKALVASIEKLLPKAFGLLPKTKLEVRPCEPHKEKNDVAARYHAPPEDLSRPGLYIINTYEPHTRQRFTMAALAAHEAVPGHHLQLALSVEQKGLPAFRKLGSSTAFVEGWALYAEQLAGELGLYQDDLSRLGALTLQSWRAARLVLDTGIHAMGWSREKALEFFLAHSPGSEHEIEGEIDRYTIWPGQALAYTMGKREILAIREESRRRLGARFDLRRFHDVLLAGGAVPLPILRASILG